MRQPFEDSLDSASSESSSGLTIEKYFLSSVFFLAVAFLVLAGVSFTRFVLIFVYKHNPKSLETSFYCLGGVWGLLRAVFFLLTLIFPDNDAMNFVYGLPTNIQVAVYSLLLLYCAQRVHYAIWDKLHWKLYWVFIITNAVLFIVYIVGTSIVITVFNSDFLMILDSSIFLLCFMLIAIAFVGYSIALIRQKKRGALFKHENPKPLIALTIIIALCMSIHCIWDVISLVKGSSVDFSSQNVKDQLTVFFSFLIWELVPAAAVIGFFGRIPTGGETVNWVEPPITITVDEDSMVEPSATAGGKQETEEKQKLLAAPPRRSTDSTSPGSLTASLRHGSSVIPNAAIRGTAPLVSHDGSTPNFGFVNKQLAVLAAGEVTGLKPYVPPERSSLEFNRSEDLDFDDS